VRHGKKCRREHPGLPPDHKDCNCRKAIYIYENGEDHPISAKTRSWEEAEKVAQAERDKRNPDKQEVAELKKQLAAKKEAEAAKKEAEATKKTLTIEDATERWAKAQKGVEATTAATHQWVVSRVRAWAKNNRIETVDQLNSDNLNRWREDWSPVAEKPYNQLEPSTQVTFQSYLKGICRYIVDLGGYLEKSPAEGLKPIKVEDKEVRYNMREGTNKLHGDAFMIDRNSAFDSDGFSPLISTPQASPSPPRIWKQIGEAQSAAPWFYPRFITAITRLFFWPASISTTRTRASPQPVQFPRRLKSWGTLESPIGDR